MHRPHSLFALLTLGGLTLTAEQAMASKPVAVSPGKSQETVLVNETCPTFSWTSVDDAEVYELVVWRLVEGNEPQPRIEQQLPYGAQSWTPSLGQCLNLGGRYAWAIRGIGKGATGEWSEPALFTVVTSPNEQAFREALASVQRYLAATDAEAPAPLPEASRSTANKKHLRSDKEKTQDSEDSPQTLLATPDTLGIAVNVPETTGITFGVQGISNSVDTGSVGVVGQSTAASGDVAGVVGQVASGAGAAGVFDNTAAGDILRGLNHGVQVFSVDGTGTLAIAGTLQTGNTTGTSYNSFGTGTPTTGAATTPNDVFVSDDIEVGDDLQVIDDIILGSQLTVGDDSSTNDDVIVFDEDEHITWDESQDRFEISNELAINGVLRVGNTASTPVGYNVFGDSANPASGDIQSDEDVYIGDALEVDGVLYLNDELRMGLEEGDQSIQFFDNGSQTGNRFFWDDSLDEFRLTDTLTISGTLNANTKNFKIDHPLDPREKYLFHASVESPDMMTVYNGNIITDAGGEAVVQLPTYFEALNRDYRYQLTPIGVFAQAIVAEEIVENRFTIRTDQPYVKVSWQVTGIRQDRWAKDNPLIPEMEKPKEEQGTLMHELQSRR